jgi:hypothetical protein
MAKFNQAIIKACPVPSAEPNTENQHPIIMLQIGEPTWTQKALHAACRQARQTGAELALVKMIPVQQPGWLGTELGYLNYSASDQADLANYEAIIEDYGVSFTAHLFQYMTLINGLIQAAEAVKAEVVFADVPVSRLPYWSRLQHWWLRRGLVSRGRRLIEARFSGGCESTAPDSTANDGLFDNVKSRC